ncbi:HEAT repeat domain-containing protein [Pyxidicoccus xibeiensis]|uniref:HEAT repeat domain-containing protein n=1 Tax=Pyxidicoccus xibeiensis TaxID=2906759 RepID=UPI0020A6F5EE|nr:HEAT repeat domain-containing protein [Pyxidicoccus xibeiensis]MCP3136625.1 HEAT repeat domain-containing protein [Pyxidicoccus xibeiensis]
MNLLAHPSAADFLRGFQEEHLSELEFLLGQRQRRLREPALSWRDAESVETRIEGHLEAMRAGGPVAVSIASEALSGGDVSLIPAALFSLASLAPEALAPDALPAPKEEWPEFLSSWEGALVLADHPGIPAFLTRVLLNDRPEVRAAAARALGRRRDKEGPALVPLLDDAAMEVRSAAALSLAKCAHQPVLPTLERMLHVPSELALLQFQAALLLGSRHAFELCRGVCEQGGAPAAFIELFAMAGGEHGLPVLLRLSTVAASTAPALAAMGIVGNGGSIPQLIEHLSDGESVAQAAASALQLITGAGLTRKVSVPAPDDEDEPATEMEMPSIDPVEWNRWWGLHQGRFGSGRYRAGKPLVMWSIVEELAEPRSSLVVRTRAGLEFTLRSGQRLDFEPDWPIARQRAVIAGLGNRREHLQQRLR